MSGLILRVLVTGVAGFIGSHLAERLVEIGHHVTGIDCFTPYYPRRFKEENVADLKTKANFEFIERDIVDLDLGGVIAKVNFVFHLAAQPGVRASWSNFEAYLRHNLNSTQRLLEACRNHPLKRFVFASSSSVYGEAESYPTPEHLTPKPISPYGITKTAAEKLCQVYMNYYDIPVIILRYFTVYGPRQRPDMGIYRFIEDTILDREVTIYGDGNQSRDFTYISDIVDGTIRTIGASPEVNGEILNLGRGAPATINEVVTMITNHLSKEPRIKYEQAKEGDVSGTFAEISKARNLLGYKPETNIMDGLKLQIKWQEGRYEKT